MGHDPPRGGPQGLRALARGGLLEAGLTAGRPPRERARGVGSSSWPSTPAPSSEGGGLSGRPSTPLTGAVTAVAPAPGVSDVMLPGGPEVRSRAERQAQGVPIPEDTWTALVETASPPGVDVPQPA